MEAERRPMRQPGGGLPAERTQANRFDKTRSAQSAAVLEDYVELIDDLLADFGPGPAD